MDIKKILQEIAENETEHFKAFRERFVSYCTRNEKAVFKLFRLLRSMEMELSGCLNGKIVVNVDREIIVKVLKTIRTELEIIKCKMRHPQLFIAEPEKSLPPVGTWTHDKIDLIELIYSIKNCVDHGKVSIKELQRACEYIFQIKLGNIYDRLSEINERQGSKARFLESLIKNLNGILEELK